MSMELFGLRQTARLHYQKFELKEVAQWFFSIVTNGNRLHFQKKLKKSYLQLLLHASWTKKGTADHIHTLWSVKLFGLRQTVRLHYQKFELEEVAPWFFSIVTSGNRLQFQKKLKRVIYNYFHWTKKWTAYHIHSLWSVKLFGLGRTVRLHIAKNLNWRRMLDKDLSILVIVSEWKKF